MANKRRFGRVRRLPSGRFQARYHGPDGIDRPAAQTFATKRDAEVWLTQQEVEIRADNWVDPDLGKVAFETYARAWLQDRVLKPRTAELYDGLLRNHLSPFFGNYALVEIREPHVRRWRKEQLESGAKSKPKFGDVTVAKAYRLLHSILATAADDKVIKRNPCRIKGAGEEHSPERPVVELPDLIRLLDTIPARYRAMLLMATFASLRFGELAALRRSDVDLDRSVVRVVRSLAQMNDGKLIDQEPKSRAGRRTVAFPREIGDELR
jgi:integrase